MGLCVVIEQYRLHRNRADVPTLLFALEWQVVELIWVKFTVRAHTPRAPDRLVPLVLRKSVQNLAIARKILIAILLASSRVSSWRGSR